MVSVPVPGAKAVHLFHLFKIIAVYKSAGHGHCSLKIRIVDRVEKIKIRIKIED